MSRAPLIPCDYSPPLPTRHLQVRGVMTVAVCGHPRSRALSFIVVIPSCTKYGPNDGINHRLYIKKLTQTSKAPRLEPLIMLDQLVLSRAVVIQQLLSQMAILMAALPSDAME